MSHKGCEFMFDLYEALIKGNPDLFNGRQAAYFSECLSADVAMFRWKLFGETKITDSNGKTLDPRWIEVYLNSCGSFGAEVEDGKIKIAPFPARTGNLNQYGDAVDMFGVTRNGDQITGTIGEDTFICYNQSSRLADLDLCYFPDLFARIDEAIEACLKWSKPAPIIAASDSKAQKTINDTIEEIMNGTPAVIVDGEILTQMRQGSSYTVDITNPERVRNIQYLSELFDEAVKRFYTKRGIDIHRTAKHAQVTTSESDGMQVFSWVHPLDRLRNRQQFVDDLTAKHPKIQLSVEFNEPWNMAYQAFIRSMTEPEPEKESENNADSDTSNADNSEEPDGSGSTNTD